MKKLVVGLLSLALIGGLSTAAVIAAETKPAAESETPHYPLKEPREVNAFIAILKASGIARILRIELTVEPPMAGRLFGTGMIVVNPPFTLEAEMRTLLPPLAGLLAVEGRGGWKVEWVRGE